MNTLKQASSPPRIVFASLALAALAVVLVLPASAAPPRGPEARQPVFKLVVEGVEMGTFTEVSGLGSSNEIIEYREGTDTGEIVRKIPGRLKWSDITLKRGFTSGNELWRWRALVEDGMTEEARRDGSLVLLSRNGHELGHWTFRNAWPASIEGAIESDDCGTVATEEVTIVVEYLQRVP